MGVAVLVGFLALASHQLVGLHARSTLAAATHDAARAAATHSGPPAQRMALGEAELRRRLGAIGSTATIDWTGTTAEVVELRVVIDAPGLLPIGLAGERSGRLEHTTELRVERLR
jgi:hypothetical protein